MAKVHVTMMVNPVRTTVSHNRSPMICLTGFWELIWSDQTAIERPKSPWAMFQTHIQ